MLKTDFPKGSSTRLYYDAVFSVVRIGGTLPLRLNVLLLLGFSRCSTKLSMMQTSKDLAGNKGLSLFTAPT